MKLTIAAVILAGILTNCAPAPTPGQGWGNAFPGNPITVSVWSPAVESAGDGQAQ